MAGNSHRSLDQVSMAHNSPISQHNHGKQNHSTAPRAPSSAAPSAMSVMLDHEHQHLGVASKKENLAVGEEDDSESIFISANTKAAQKMISPFLTQHLPQAYNPNGLQPEPQGKPDTKFCYRHRPDMKCRRAANEPSMEQMQTELGKLSQSDQQGISTVWSLFSAAPAKQRNLMLQGILAQCCFPQLSFISNSVRELIKIDFMSALPPELGFKILCHLDTNSLCRASQVSQRWRTLADDDVVWHKMCEQHINQKCTKCGWGLPLLEQKRLRSEKRSMQLRAGHRGINEWSPQITPLPFTEPAPSIEDRHDDPHPSPAKRSFSTTSLQIGEEHGKRVCSQSIKDSKQERSDYFDHRKKRPWKDVYKDRFKVGTNWKYGRCSLKTFTGHTNGVMCLQFDNDILATGSYDNTAKIWDIETGKELRTLTGHTAGIRCLQFDTSLLYTGSIDGTLKVWNWRTGECVRTFRGHTRGVISLHFSDKILASGSMDNTIKIWNLADKQAYALRGHTDWVNSVKIDSPSRTLFSASDDCTARLWDLDTRQCIKVFKGHVGQVQQVFPLPPEFELHGEDTHTHDHSDQEAAEGGSTSPPHLARSDSQTSDPSKPSPPKYMLTGSLDSTIRLWHVPSGRCIRTFFGHLEGIWALAADTLRMVSGAEDRMVKVWDPRTGQHERTFTGHAGPVTCVGLSDSRLATGSEDSSVRLYSFEANNSAHDSAENGVVCRGTPG